MQSLLAIVRAPNDDPGALGQNRMVTTMPSGGTVKGAAGEITENGAPALRALTLETRSCC
jgi:hypothetical protein